MKAEKLKKIKNLLILKKYDSCLDKENKIKNALKNYFHTENILELNNKILIGKLFKEKSPRFDKNKNLIPYSFVGPNRIFFLKRRKALKGKTPFGLNDGLFQKNNDLINQINNILNKEMNNKTSQVSNHENINQESYYKCVDNNYLKNLYKTIINKIKKNKSMDNKKFNKTMQKDYFNLPEPINFNLIKQEKILKKYLNFQKLIQKINKVTLKKSNKPNKDLLLNMINKSSYCKSDDNLYVNDNLKNWNFKLRNSKINGIYERKGYLKTISKNEDLYSTVNLNKKKEIFVNPFKTFKKSFMNERNKKINKELKNFKSLETLKIDGNNLFDYEYKNEMKLKGKKKLYDFFNLNEIKFKNEYKKKLSELEITKNINEIYKDKIFAYDYSFNNNSQIKSSRKTFFNTTTNRNKYKSIF